MAKREEFCIPYIDPGSGITILHTGGWIVSLLLGGLGSFFLFLRQRKIFKKNWKRIGVAAVLILILIMKWI